MLQKKISCIDKFFEIEGKTDSEVFIWLGTCFGGCDVPLEVEKLGVDLIIQFGVM